MNNRTLKIIVVQLESLKVNHATYIILGIKYKINLNA